MRNVGRNAACAVALAMTVMAVNAAADTPRAPFLSVTDSERGVPGHVRHADIAEGRWTTGELRLAGERLFLARFTPADGVGRPAATGARFPTPRAPVGVGFSRAFGPDANSCQSCHNSPGPGGAGDFATNAFVGLADYDPPVHSLDRQFSNERGTPAINGLGVIELLAREMTAELHRLRDAAIAEAAESGEPVTTDLAAKGVGFGEITATPEGDVLTDGVEGVDHDLVIRPFGQKGVFVSLRDFTVTACNIHHGMQADERFGVAQTGTSDFDGDGVDEELTTGDVTALTVWQATLNVPGVVLAPESSLESHAAGRAVFDRIGCAVCHVPEMRLESAEFVTPGPYNPAGTLREGDAAPVSVNLASSGPTPRVAADEGGGFVVAAFTDLKRHSVSDPDAPFFHNETRRQRFLPTDQFLTKRLWAVGNTGPYGHRGDIATIDEAIVLHGGEATDSRVAYERLSSERRQEVLAFLRALQVVPEGSPAVIRAAQPDSLPYADQMPAVTPADARHVNAAR